MLQSEKYQQKMMQNIKTQTVKFAPFIL